MTNLADKNAIIYTNTGNFDLRQTINEPRCRAAPELPLGQRDQRRSKCRPGRARDIRMSTPGLTVAPGAGFPIS